MNRVHSNGRLIQDTRRLVVSLQHEVSDHLHERSMVNLHQRCPVPSEQVVPIPNEQVGQRFFLLLLRRLTGYKLFCCLAFGSAAKHQSPLAGGRAGIYFHPTSALHLQDLTDPLHQVDQYTLLVYF